VLFFVFYTVEFTNEFSVRQVITPAGGPVMNLNGTSIGSNQTLPIGNFTSFNTSA